MRIIAVRCARKRRSKEEKEVVKMPILQYKCKKCGKRFEELVKSHTDTVVCPVRGMSLNSVRTGYRRVERVFRRLYLAAGNCGKGNV